MQNDLDIDLTEAACKQLRQSLTEASKTAVRLSLREAGCSGLEYVMDYADAACAGDLKQAFDGFVLYVDAEDYAKALQGLQVDYQQDVLSSSFVYHNPNKKGECGCGVSFTV